MRYLITIFSILFINNISVCQQSENKFKLNSSFAIGGTDERIFGFNENYTNELLQINANKIAPSIYFDFGVKYNFLSLGKLNFYGGVNYAFEWNNSHRSYNHCIITGTPCPYVLLFVDGYSYHMLGLSFTLDYVIYNLSQSQIKIGAQISPKFRFLTYYDSRLKYYWNIEYLFTEFLPQISIARPKYEIGLFTRLWQHRKVDRGIYPAGSGSGHPVLTDNYMNINPWKIGVFIKYDVPFRKSNSKLKEAK